MSPIKIIKREIIEGLNESKWFPLVLALSVLYSLIGPLVYTIYVPYLHVPFVIAGILIMLKKGSISLNKAGMLFIIYIPLSILVDSPDPVFKSWIRYIMFCLIFLIAGPFVSGSYIANVRKRILHGILFIATVVSILSFPCYFLGINYMTSQADGSMLTEYMGAAGAGTFGGLAIQSIVLGMFCGISILYLLYRAMSQPKGERLWYWVAICILFMTILFSASRSALIASVAGCLVFIYQISKRNGGFIKILLSITFIGMLTFPLWEGATAGIIGKTERDGGSVMNSREEKWGYRIAEFQSSPITGIGFASVDPQGGDDYDMNGTIEPGNSWLAVLSMTGLVGLLLLLGMLAGPYKYLRLKSTPYNALLLSLFVFFCLHFMAEGYVFAAASTLCFTAWLVFGCAYDAKCLS